MDLVALEVGEDGAVSVDTATAWGLLDMALVGFGINLVALVKQ